MKITKNTEVSLEELASITSRTKSWLNKLAADGHFKSERHGSYRIGNVIAGLLKHAREDKRTAMQTPAITRVQQARARQIEQRMAMEAKELISFSEHCAIMDLLIGGVSAELDGMPAQLTRDPGLRAEYEKRFNAMKQRLVDKWAAMAEGAPEEEGGDGEDE